MGYNLTKRNPLYELIADYTVTGSAITSYTFDLSATPIAKTEDWVLVSDIVCPTSGGVSYFITVNGTDTYTSYHEQYIYADSTTVSGGRNNQPILADQPIIGKVESVCNLKLTNSGYFTYQSKTSRSYGVSTTQIQNNYGTSTFTMSNITTLKVIAQTSNAIGIGTRFQLYRIRPASKIADVTIGSAVTSYTFDLSATPIGKGSEFMLVAFVNNTSASNSEYYLFSNNSIVNSSYYTQYFGAYSTTLESGRLNGTYCLYSPASRSTQSISNIKLTNNGYVVWQSCQTREVSASSITAYNAYGTSTFTTSAITSLQITSSVASAIGIGTRFQLYKLK